MNLRALSLRALVVICGVVALALAASLAWHQYEATASSASVDISPGATAGRYSDGQAVEVSMGTNSVFQAGTKVNILECADPGGTTADLPKSDTTCDGNTIQGETVLVGAGGSVPESKYTIYELPSPTLGESSTGQPVCNQSNMCVLYVGENQNDFTQPKLFSAPFLVGSGSGSSGSGDPSPAGSSGSSSSSSSSSTSSQGASSDTPTVGGSSSADSTNPGSSNQVGSSSATAGSGGAQGDPPETGLAYTGVSPVLYVLGTLGVLLVALGGLGRMWLGVRSR